MRQCARTSSRSWAAVVSLHAHRPGAMGTMARTDSTGQTAVLARPPEVAGGSRTARPEVILFGALPHGFGLAGVMFCQPGHGPGQRYDCAVSMIRETAFEEASFTCCAGPGLRFCPGGRATLGDVGNAELFRRPDGPIVRTGDTATMWSHLRAQRRRPRRAARRCFALLAGRFRLQGGRMRGFRSPAYAEPMAGAGSSSSKEHDRLGARHAGPTGEKAAEGRTAATSGERRRAVPATGTKSGLRRHRSPRAVRQSFSRRPGTAGNCCRHRPAAVDEQAGIGGLRAFRCR